MNEEPAASRALTRTEASAAVTGLGWRYVLGVARTFVRTESLRRAAEAAAVIAAAGGQAADGRLLIDIRPDCMILTVPSAGNITAADTELVGRISEILADLGLEPAAQGPDRSVQVLEIAIDALDIPAIRPFWRAALGYCDEPGHSGPRDPVVDPDGQGPAIWFQQMTEPRPQRNRIHLDVSVPHDETSVRIQAALAAGGKLVSDAAAPAFWVLADAEGNEACITTWQGRDA